MVFVYENDSIIPKNLRLSFLSQHVNRIPLTARGENLLLKEIITNKKNLSKKIPPPRT